MSDHPPVEGPAVWRGDELSTMQAWNRRLDDAQLDELRHAALGDEAVPLPRLGALGRALRDELEDGPGAVRLGGLDPATLIDRDHVVERDVPLFERLFLAFAHCVGTPVSQNIEGDTLFRVADARLTEGDRRARGPNSRAALTFHSDRCDVIGFLCLRPAASGGENLLVSAGAIHNEILRTRPELLETLYAPFAWQRHTIDTANERPYYDMPVFARTEGRFATTLMQVLIERAHRAADAPDLTDAQRDALELVQRLAADPAFHLRFRQRPGEILLLNNYVTLHSRTAFDDPGDAAGRLLLRVWLSVPNSRALPDSWAAHYGETEPGVVRGGIRPART